MNTLISIIIPCFNDAAYVEQAVQSAINQTYPNKEIIVVDDGSNNETKAILKKLEPTIDLLITQKNKGQSAARNRGIEAAQGQYILILDSDDYFEVDFCEKAVSVLEGVENVRLVSCEATLHFEDGGQQVFKPIGGRLENFMFSNSALGNAAAFRKRDWKACGGYDENMRQGWEDWEFYIRLMQLGGICYIIPEPLFHYRKRAHTTTARANQMKYKLWHYIFTKHPNLYKENYEAMVDFFLQKIAHEEREKIKITKRIEYRVGENILLPFRKIKKLF